MIIAEIGLNHLGNTRLAKHYIDTLVKTDVDAITFQIREPEFYSNKWFIYDLILDKDIYFYAKEQTQKTRKKLGIAIGDIKYIDFFELLNVDFYKVIRNDITDFKLIDKLKNTKKEIIVSTGLSSEDEIYKFVEHIEQDKNFTLNHTQLSFETKDCNLSAIEDMKSKYKLNVSFGSHCNNHNVLYMSLNYKPSDILFYVKSAEFVNSDENWPDHDHAILLKDVEYLVKNLKLLPMAIGDGKKRKMINKIEELL